MKKAVSESQRKAVLRAWRASGKSARVFCEGRGLKEQQLYWWARSAETKSRRKKIRVRLVEAIPVETGVTPRLAPDPDQRWTWELAGRGAVLRGSDLDASTLLILMAAVTTTGDR